MMKVSDRHHTNNALDGARHTAEHASPACPKIPDITVRAADRLPVPTLDQSMPPRATGILPRLLSSSGSRSLTSPDPARYGLHKLIVAHERGAKHPKHDKDILQALALIEWHLQRAPHALIDAWVDLTRHGAGWVKRACASLALPPVQQRELVARFERVVKFRK